MPLLHLRLRDQVIDNYAVPMCMAVATSIHYEWNGTTWARSLPHPCSWRGRYFVRGTYLCGHHAKMDDVELQDDAMPEPIAIAIAKENSQ